MSKHKKKHHSSQSVPALQNRHGRRSYAVGALVAVILLTVYFILSRPSGAPEADTRNSTPRPQSASLMREDTSAPAVWIRRAEAIDAHFHDVYTPCWEGAYGAIGDAYLFAATHDSSLYRFHLLDHDLKQMCVGRWVDDRAWICLAECIWWDVTGRTDAQLVQDAAHRYLEARMEKRFSNVEGFWSWYNWPPGSEAQEQIFTNSNMNQMVTVACWLYLATGEHRFLQDALLAWNGDGTSPGIEKTWYKGNGAGYCSVAAALYRATHDARYRNIALATARRIMDPKNNWVDPKYFYQLRMDGNGAFVNFLFDAYATAPDSLPDLLPKIRTMLEHVWTNHDGESVVTLHRESDNGIRNGWNPYGGEDGYNVDEVGTVHAQGEAARAFGTFTYYFSRSKSPR